MLDWFRQARDKAIPLSGPILQSKALEFASQLDIANFKASNGHEKYPATGYKSNSRSVTWNLVVDCTLNACTHL